MRRGRLAGRVPPPPTGPAEGPKQLYPPRRYARDPELCFSEHGRVSLTSADLQPHISPARCEALQETFLGTQKNKSLTGSHLVFSGSCGDRETTRSPRRRARCVVSPNNRWRRGPSPWRTRQTCNVLNPLSVNQDTRPHYRALKSTVNTPNVF